MLNLFVMQRFLSPSPIWQQNGIFLLRIIVGGFLIYHGCEVFDKVKMHEYETWDTFKGMGKSFLPYLGKSLELIAGICLFLGLFTRFASMMIMGTLGYITFFVGGGKVWYEDQHPFLFVLLALVFIFTGPGNYSLDQFLFKPKTSN
jgi:putative oxidoreductase